jgi:hypothetical protein
MQFSTMTPADPETFRPGIVAHAKHPRFITADRTERKHRN